MADATALNIRSDVRDYHDVQSQLQRHVYARSEAALTAGDARRAAITSAKDLAQHRHKVREAFIASFGGLPSSDHPLSPRCTGTLHGDGFRIEKLIYSPRPGVHITANLYVPDNLTQPTGAVLFVCGHNRDAKAFTQYQDVCQQFAQAGLVVLAQDPPGQGERQRHLASDREMWGVVEHDLAGDQCLMLGDGLARYFVHDAIRGLDVLCSRPEVDPSRLGVTGNSGGGTQTAMLMLVDDRLAAAAPATFIMDRRSYLHAGGAQDAEQIWRGFAAHGYDHHEILLAMAPKPVLVLAVTWDFFPIEGTRRTVNDCQRVWDLLGAAGRLQVVEDRSRHNYTLSLARAATAFFSEHLLDGKARPARPLRPFPESQLNATASGQVQGEIPGAKSPFDENGDRLATLPSAPASAASLATWLRGEIHRDRRSAPVNLRIYHELVVDGLHRSQGYWFTQPDLCGHGILFRSESAIAPSVIVALWDDGTRQIPAHAEWIRTTCATGKAVLVLDVTGAGSLTPHPLGPLPADNPYGSVRKYTDDLIALGDSLAALRCFDVTRVPAALDEWPGISARAISGHAEGLLGTCLALAALIEPRFQTVDERLVRHPADLLQQPLYDQQGVHSVILPGLVRQMRATSR